MRLAWLGAIAALACGSGASDGDTSSIPLRAPSASATAAAAGRPAAKGMCETRTADDHFCVQLDDDELVREFQASCPGMVKDQSCPLGGVSGVCLLPDGSMRYGYPPRTPATHEKFCKSMQGKYSTGNVPPSRDAITLVSCEGKFDSACEEEEVHASPRLSAAAQECKDFGGVHVVGARCSRAKATFTCDLKGKRMVVGRSASSFEARKRFCDERHGALLELNPSDDPSGSASASAEPALDLDPPEATPDVRIRTQ